MQIERIKAKMGAEIDLLIGKNPAHAHALLEEIQREIFENLKPLKFEESDPMSVLHTRQDAFERLCFRLRQEGIQEPTTLSTYSFYKTVELINQKAQKNVQSDRV